jgi:hypothetical protein
VSTLDFSIVAMQHINWKLNLAWSMRYGHAISEEQVATASDCELGQWLSDEGLSSYDSMADVGELDRIHRECHQCGRRAVQLRNAGETDRSDVEFERVEELSRQILDLLSAISRQVSGQPAP